VSCEASLPILITALRSVQLHDNNTANNTTQSGHFYLSKQLTESIPSHTPHTNTTTTTMPPKKRTTTRPAQRQPQQVVSDYDETDTAAFTDNAAANIAPPPSRTNTELNLLVLRRYCPDVERIVQIAPFAVVYSFSPDTQGWEKIGTEGTLFVCQLAGASYSRYSVIILNRKSLDNFIVELVSAENVEITDSYVILQSPGEDGVDQIYGLFRGRCSAEHSRGGRHGH
jgi:hypothetical protein